MFNVIINEIEDLKVQKIAALSGVRLLQLQHAQKVWDMGTGVLKETPVPNVDDPLLCWDLWEGSAALAPSPVVVGCDQS